MKAMLEAIDSMNLPIYKGTKQSMKRYIEGVMIEARNFSVLRASEFLNFSYQRLQYLVSEARFKDGDVEIERLQWAVSQSGHQGGEYNFVIDDTQSKKWESRYRSEHSFFIFGKRARDNTIWV